MLSKVITISQQKGGTGKTTLAVHLAMAFIKYHNLKVAIIDTDPQGSLGKWFMIRSERKVSNENLTFKTASLWGAQYESKTLKNDHDIVIIDTPPKIESDARPSIEAADLVLIPMAASHVDFWATGAIVEIAKKANKKILAQINRSSQRSKLIDKTKDFIKSLDLQSTDTIIGNRQIYTSSMGEGKTAVEKQRKGNAVDEIKKLSGQILNQLN
ncbi:ParA family protein [Pelagibacterales bacterium SAG-MED27]|jgi:chromosome partitioning protein|nr:ParA family protein [Pelagibacterales bacterium SAG-MED50]MBD1149748.1 ParA family protein [Pelagibacterales bacterium SAG-MED27]MBD1168320.1 ParA family protein [Pelagibacterales bacterium SAG-MED06]